MVGCTPSVRYTRDQSGGGQPVAKSDNKSRQSAPARQGNFDYDDADSIQSGWEASSSAGTERHKADWLAAALSEADQGPSASGRQDGAKTGDSQRLKQVINMYMGVPYKYGGTTRQGFDCSGFVSAVYLEVYGIQLKRTSGAMWKDGTPVALSAARPGDLVFFKGGTFGTIDHVGIYVGLTRFAHASTKSGVTYGNLKDTHYARRFAGVRRMF
jgi:cell wall-associated NlpC family hydrolase